jgi:hypothetical protein
VNSLTFQLPIPDAKLRTRNTVGSLGGRIVKARMTKAARVLAKAEALRVLDGEPGPMWKKAGAKVVLFHLAARTMDPDNFIASLKAYFDGICDAGVVANDRGLWPERPEYRRTDKFPRVEITIQPEQ